MALRSEEVWVLRGSNWKEDTNKEETAMNQWSFNINNIGQIDFDLIRESLSYKQPLGLVSVGNTQHFVVIHKSLSEKASVCRYPYNKRILKMLKKGMVDIGSDIGSFGDLIRLAKEIKEQPIKKKYKVSAEVTVVLPKVD